MPYCPQCGAEYREGFTRCHDCDEELLPGAPPDDVDFRPERRDAFDPYDVPVLTTVYQADRIGAQLIRSVLEGNGIRAVVAGEGYSSAYPLTVGAIGEGRVQVPEEDRERALELIAEATRGDHAEEVDEPEEPYRRRWHLVGVAVVVIGLLFAGALEPIVVAAVFVWRAVTSLFS